MRAESSIELPVQITQQLPLSRSAAAAAMRLSMMRSWSSRECSRAPAFKSAFNCVKKCVIVTGMYTATRLLQKNHIRSKERILA